MLQAIKPFVKPQKRKQIQKGFYFYIKKIQIIEQYFY